MIIDTLSRAGRYHALHPDFARAFEFLNRLDLAELPSGHYPIDGDNVHASVHRGPGRERAEAKLEVHRKYIDIQFVIAGEDVMGWKSVLDLKSPSGEYDSAKDVIFFEDRARIVWFSVYPGMFAVFFSEDAHAPMANAVELHKVVIKVARLGGS